MSGGGVDRVQEKPAAHFSNQSVPAAAMLGHEKGTCDSLIVACTRTIAVLPAACEPVCTADVSLSCQGPDIMLLFCHPRYEGVTREDIPHGMGVMIFGNGTGGGFHFREVKVSKEGHVTVIDQSAALTPQLPAATFKHSTAANASWISPAAALTGYIF